ncbi:carboxyl transferase domain-containing protein [Subtercola boreus]|uniref:Acetyl-coenzyme A carboxylase carboxyl transferase subunits beta/alpha n=1 Tax=Subtercola boreus TaxID=120213 RepID=A0A3E0WEJ7_9MICO|nr:carboxyl transferase domain-containing protein [Subtercola boreus]RFA23652.1 acetyl-CoA carboxyl transferase [Subtercola boreus]RFA24046.1 acetyl-CoA carboxyl transferase [Subtercola boreus]RFA29744.1 acetyl-CoA carboxyl transferase [Subtercola boreus]
MTTAANTATHLGARALIDLITDDGTFASWDEPVVDVHPDAAYADALSRAAARSGADESVLTGEGLIRGRRVAVIVCEFSFLAGSIGVAAAERLVEAIERATRERIPILAGPASGGTRMQEGTVAFLSMVKISAAVAAHRAAGLPYLVYLRHPTTGGVMASWASLGHVTVAEPGALVGFLGPRVYEALYGDEFPEGVQTSENMFRHGLVDAVVAPERLPGLIDRALSVLLGGAGGGGGAGGAAGTPGAGRTPSAGGAAGAPGAGTTPPAGPPAELERFTGTLVSAWDSITRSRRATRPGLRALLRTAASDVLPLNGTGQGESDPGLLLALARFGSQPCIVLGHDRLPRRSGAPLGPAALREARRGIRLSHELGIPLVTVIDTPGAALSKAAEEGGLAGEIARCLAELIMLPSPTVSVILGEGTGGGALALLPADVTLSAQHGWLSPLPPEGASAILFRDTEHAAELAEAQGVASTALLNNGIVDHVVPEHPDAADEPAAFCLRIGAAVEHALAELTAERAEDRLTARLKRYRTMGLQ